MTKFTKSKTCRGFILYEFEDIYGEKCSIQNSSLADDYAIWLGIDEARNHPVTNEPLSPRMHINIPLAKKIIKKLQKFVDTGSL